MHNTIELSDVPAFVFVDRRRTPDRRTVWRGGRRDSDWTINRPQGVLALEPDTQRVNVLRRWFSSRATA